jgi:nitrate reductase delta subunit
MRSFQALSALLSYPSAELKSAIPEIAAAIDAEGLVAGADRRALDPLLAEIAQRDLFDLQERYVLLFDRTRTLSLHLFEHVYGDSRDRGPAMIDLREVYLKGGMALARNELPDYLPVFLEFLASQPLAEAVKLLAEPAHVLAALDERLRKRRSSYGAVFRALIALTRVDVDAALRRAIAAERTENPDDPEALDKSWAEMAVEFGPGAIEGEAASCPRADTVLARMNPPRPQGARP